MSGAQNSMLSPAEVARCAGLSRAAVYRAIERGELKASRLCGRLRVEPTEFEDWKRRGLVRPTAPATPMVGGRASKSRVADRGFLSELRERQERRVG